MTSALTRAKEWLVAPPGGTPPLDDESGFSPPADPGTEGPRRWLAPVPSQRDERVEVGVAHDLVAPPRATVARAAPGVADDLVAPPRATVARVSDKAHVAPGEWVAVLGEQRDVPVVAAGVALALRRRRRAAVAVVALWPCGDDSAESSALAAPAFPGARLLAGRLARRGLPARARGRLVWLSLAAGATRRLHIDAPSVLAVMAPRDEAVDRIVALCGHALVAAEPASPLASVAIAGLADLGVAARAVAPPAPGAARLAMLAGLRSLRLDDEWAPV